MTEATEIETLAATVRAGLDADERDALAGRGIFPRPAVDDDGAVCLHVKPGGNMAVTWYRNPAEGYRDMADLKNWANTENGWTRERVLAEVASKRAVVDLLLAEGHGYGWTEQCYGNPCLCGRDGRVTAYLTLLAEPYTEAS